MSQVDIVGVQHYTPGIGHPKTSAPVGGAVLALNEAGQIVDSSGPVVVGGSPTPFTFRALTSADNGATLTVAAAQTATMVAGLGTSFGCAFYNKTGSPVVLTISVPTGVTVNGVTNGTLTRTIPAWGVTAIQSTDVADVYVAPGA